MAAPSIRSVTHVVHNNAPYIIFDKPTGTLENDIIAVLFKIHNTESISDVAGPTFLVPAGFTQKTFADQTNAGSGTEQHRLYLYWKRAGASEPDQYAFVWTTNATNAVWVGAIKDAKLTGDPFDFASQAAAGSADTTSPAVSGTTTGADRFLLAGFANATGNVPLAAPTGFTEEWNSGGEDVCYKTQAAAGATGTVQVNWDTFSIYGTAILAAIAPSTAPPVADFHADQVSIVTGTTVQFTDDSTNTPTSWAWTFGSGEGTASSQNPTHQYNVAGSFTVTLTATNAAGSDLETKTAYIMVSQAPPVAAFSGTPLSGVRGTVVAFTDESTQNPSSWLWDFGDGNTSTLQNPTHAYGDGTFTVTLTATNASGSDSEVKTNYVGAITAPTAGEDDDLTAPGSVSLKR